MGRPIGSKNKKKPKFVDNSKEEEHVEIGIPLMPPPPIIVTDCLECHHSQDMHYGSEKNWCNTPNCRCQAYKVVQIKGA